MNQLLYSLVTAQYTAQYEHGRIHAYSGHGYDLCVVRVIIVCRV
jgi:hypothetical protein